MPPRRPRKSRDWTAGVGESRGLAAPGRRYSWRVQTSDRGDESRGWKRKLRLPVRARSGEPVLGSAWRVRRGRPDADQTVSGRRARTRSHRRTAIAAGRRDSEVLETALREGLGIIDRIRSKADLGEEEAYKLAHRLVHEGRIIPRSRRSPSRSSRS